MRTAGYLRSAGASLVLLALSASVALAQRPDVSRMDCSAAQSLIQQSGAIVVTTGRHTYSRFVAGQGFCDAGERFLHPAYTRTTDKRACFIGYTCESWDLYFSDD